MEVVITALGPDNLGLADPIIHHVTGRGARITEIQMYDHDEEQIFAMLIRMDIDPEEFEPFVASKAQEHLLIIENFCLAQPETVRPANLAVCAFVQVKRISAPCTFAASGCV